jgi:hypothetical protein
LTRETPSPKPLTPTPAFVTHSRSPNGLPPADFRGFKWGAVPTKMMQKVGNEGLWKNPSKNLKPYFDIPVAEEAYLFDEDGKLFEGFLWFHGADNFAKLNAVLTKQFGIPNFANEGLKIFKWKWKNPEVVLELYYEKKNETTTVSLKKE